MTLHFLMTWYHTVPHGAKVDVAFTEHPLIQKALLCLCTWGYVEGSGLVCVQDADSYSCIPGSTQEGCIWVVEAQRWEISSTQERGLEKRHQGRMFALDLEELVGFLQVGNVNQKAEVREQVWDWQVVWFCRSTQCLEAEPWRWSWD